MREIRLICKKELSRVLTDRKMLFSIFLLPAIIMVVVMNVMTSFSENLENDVKSHAPIVYLQSAPEGVEQYLKAYNEKMDLRTMDDEQKVTEEIRDGSADLWIAFPQDFLEQIEVYKIGDEIPRLKFITIRPKSIHRLPMKAWQADVWRFTDRHCCQSVSEICSL